MIRLKEDLKGVICLLAIFALGVCFMHNSAQVNTMRELELEANSQITYDYTK